MATQEMKVCDVYGTTKNVKTYRIVVVTPPLIVAGIAADDCLIDKALDLCPRAVKRLARFIDRGTRASSCRGLCAP